MVGQGVRKLRVILVEDEGLFRDLLRIALSQHPRLEVVGSFPDAEAALQKAVDLRPDVAILDIELRGSMNGVQLGLLLRRQLKELGVVLLSNHRDLRFVGAVPPETVAGWSYLLKRSVSDVGTLSRAVEGASMGLVVLDPQVVSSMRPTAGGRLSRLTPRQREILALIAQGHTNAAIAERLVLAEKSVENQINLLYQQLEIDRRDPSIQPRVSAVLAYLGESRLPADG
jgi:DNA-binding NarL/FixJ family response regulator